MKKSIVILFITVLTFQFNIQQNLEAYTNYSQTIWPAPSKINMTKDSQLQIDPCSINYRVQAIPSDYVKQIINNYLIDVFSCGQISPGNVTFSIIVKDANQMIAKKTIQEHYSLTLRQNNKWDLIADYYVGFLRGFQTFSQLFEKQESGKYLIKGIPIIIDDQPEFIWRGIMIDTSRHFLSVDTIKHTIDGLLYNKMNVMHWHITDQDSFPLQIPARPQLSESGKIGGTYSTNDIKSILNYAKIRGVRIIPQIDTPAHTQSWGRSSTLKDIIVKCNSDYQGQFDPTLDLTYEVVEDVLKYINNTFDDEYMHFGGDQIEQECYDTKPSIKEWMNKNNISSYEKLQIYYREREKTLWRSINKVRKVIYWANEQINLPVKDDDVIQWWGNSKNVDKLEGKKNQIILSNYDLTYLDIGVGNRYGSQYGSYQNWRLMYSFNPNIKNVNIVGGQTCMWSQLNNFGTIDQKVWIRSSILAERLWNSKININNSLLNIVTRLIAQKIRMQQRGFKVSPVTVGLCEKDPSICFS